MAELLLPVSDEMVNELEACRGKYGWCWLSLSPLQKAHVINNVASILNRFWGNSIKSFLKGKPWRDPMKFLQDILGDESKRKYRAVSQWMLGSLDNKGFIEHIAFIIRSYLGTR
jgi:hypothetical protein